MSQISEINRRQVIPRWLDFKNACVLNLLSDNRIEAKPAVSFLSSAKVLADWSHFPSLSTAMDLVAESYLLDREDDVNAKQAADFIIKYAPRDSIMLRNLARDYLRVRGASSHVPNLSYTGIGQKCVSILKSALRRGPVNPIAWADLSFFYALLGQEEKSKRSILCAISLAPTNRFILRNACRCFIHYSDPARALSILRSSPRAKYDPWIVSAEIALSDETEHRSLFMKQAKHMISDDNLSPFSKSELFAGLSTIESKHGSRRNANKYAKECLRSPSENSLAQVQWMCTQNDVSCDAYSSESVSASYEADARSAHRDRSFHQCMSYISQWHNFQPFSCEPLIFGTFVSSVCLGDDRGAIDFAERNHWDYLKDVDAVLLNNLACSYARIGDVSKSRLLLEQAGRLPIDAKRRLMLTATQGLILMREGHLERGRQAYRDSIQGFDKLSETRSAAIASYYFASEEKRLNSAGAAESIENARRRIQNSHVFELETLVDQL